MLVTQENIKDSMLMRGVVGQTLYDSTHTRYHVKEELRRGSVHRAGNGHERAWAADPQSMGSDSKRQCRGQDRVKGLGCVECH